MHRRQHSTNYSVSRTTWPELSASVGVALTPGRCSSRSIGFQWGRGSSTRWLYWLTRCGPQPLWCISVTWYSYHIPTRALRSSDAPLLVIHRTQTELTRCAFSVAAPSIWNSLPADCTRAFPHSSATWKRICSDSLSTPVLQAPLYLQTSRRYTNVLLYYYYSCGGRYSCEQFDGHWHARLINWLLKSLISLFFLRLYLYKTFLCSYALALMWLDKINNCNSFYPFIL